MSDRLKLENSKKYIYIYLIIKKSKRYSLNRAKYIPQGKQNI